MCCGRSKKGRYTGRRSGLIKAKPPVIAKPPDNKEQPSKELKQDESKSH